eukprot:3140885-Pleurochrysis_carterae.AAC.1
MVDSPLAEVCGSGLVILSCVVFAFQTLPVSPTAQLGLGIAEDVILLIFSVEYFLRWCARAPGWHVANRTTFQPAS